MGDQDANLHIRLPRAMKDRITNIAKQRPDKTPEAVLIRQWLAEKLEDEEQQLGGPFAITQVPHPAFNLIQSPICPAHRGLPSLRDPQWIATVSTSPGARRSPSPPKVRSCG